MHMYTQKENDLYHAQQKNKDTYISSSQPCVVFLPFSTVRPGPLHNSANLP